MTNGIIGANGDMGKHLLQPLLKQLGPVVVVGRSSSPDEWKRVWKSDAIWLSIPRDAIPGVLSDVKLSPQQLMVDICSIKRRLSDVIRPTGAAFLSFHPLNGPLVPMAGQKWVVVDTDSDISNHPQAKSILNLLQQKGVSFLSAKSEDEHDFMMGIVLSLPELCTLVVDEMLSCYAAENHQEALPLEKIMEWAVPASNALYSSYVHSINSSQDWLREDLILGAHGNLLSATRRAFDRLKNLQPDDITKRVAAQKVAVSQLPLVERKRIKQWVERWFVDSNQRIFAFHKRQQHRPNLVIQEAAVTQEIFPTQKGRVSVGIHGVAGCFTHESVLRLCQELAIDPDQLDLKYLVEARRVIEATVNGEIDRGVFAMANSGSGAYVSSLRAMGEFTFDVLAIYGMEILQCLVAHPSIKKIEDIREVFGHPQAVSQCKRTFAEHYPELNVVAGQDSDDTALCAQRIAEGKLPQTTATLASQVAAQLYGLNILEYGMHHDPFNTTTFAVIRRSR